VCNKSSRAARFACPRGAGASHGRPRSGCHVAPSRFVRPATALAHATTPTTPTTPTTTATRDLDFSRGASNGVSTVTSSRVIGVVGVCRDGVTPSACYESARPRRPSGGRADNRARERHAPTDGTRETMSYGTTTSDVEGAASAETTTATTTRRRGVGIVGVAVVAFGMFALAMRGEGRMAAMKIEDGESDGATHANASVAPGPAPDVSCLEHCGDAIHSKAMGLIDMGDCTALNDVDKACFNEAGCEAARTEVNGVCPGTFA